MQCNAQQRGVSEFATHTPKTDEAAPQPSDLCDYNEVKDSDETSKDTPPQLCCAKVHATSNTIPGSGTQIHTTQQHGLSTRCLGDALPLLPTAPRAGHVPGDAIGEDGGDDNDSGNATADPKDDNPRPATAAMHPCSLYALHKAGIVATILVGGGGCVGEQATQPHAGMLQAGEQHHNTCSTMSSTMKAVTRSPSHVPTAAPRMKATLDMERPELTT